MAYYAIYLIYRAGAALVSAFSIEAAFRIGYVLGALAYWLLPRVRGVSVSNLRAAYPDKSPHRIRTLAQASFAYLGANLAAGIKMTSMSREDISKCITVQIPDEVVAQRQRDRRGWIAMLGHLGNWEAFTQLGHLLSEYKLGAAYQPLRNPFIDAHFRKLRAREGVRLFDRNSELLSAAVFLREGGALGVLVDQHAGDAGLWTPFFGRLASTSPLAATLSKRTGAPIVPMAVYTTGVARWRIVVSPFLPFVKEVKEGVASINRELEAQIRKAPSDWLWAHDRWKNPRRFFLLDRFTRGAHLPAGSVVKPFRVLIVADLIGNTETMACLLAIQQSRPDVCFTILSSSPKPTGPSLPVHTWLERKPDETIRQLVRRFSGKFDAVFFFATSWREQVAACLARIPRRVGYAGKLSSLFLTCPVVRPDKNSAARYIDLAIAAGANIALK